MPPRSPREQQVFDLDFRAAKVLQGETRHGFVLKGSHRFFDSNVDLMATVINEARYVMTVAKCMPHFRNGGEPK